MESQTSDIDGERSSVHFIENSTNEVYHNQVKNYMCKNEISKASLGTDSNKILLVLRVHLKSKTHSQNKAADTRDETAEERVEWKGSH